MDFGSRMQLISLMAIPFLLAVSLHEAGHAYCADMLGDPTPRQDKRLTLNPLRHIDPFGTVILPLMMLLAGVPFLLGYAKPVIVNPAYFRRQNLGMVLVALAGPAGNFFVAVFAAYVARFALNMGYDTGGWLVQTAITGIWLNALFLVFNMLPIPPLDGSKVVAPLLPQALRQRYEALAPFGFFLLIALVILNRDIILGPAFWLTAVVAWLVEVPL